MKLFQRIANSDAHHRLLIAAGLSLLMFIALSGRVSMTAHVFITWDFFSFCILAMAWITMISANPINVQRNAKLQNSSRTGIFIFVIASACCSLFALGALLGPAKDLPKEKLTEHVILSIVTVICSWLLVHTVFALRYAYAYYSFRKNSSEASCEGLEFPEEKEPDYMDFAYFSFVIGMTCQVSDVQISSRTIRRLALVHGLVSFAFNTVILALSINIISGLL